MESSPTRAQRWRHRQGARRAILDATEALLLADMESAARLWRLSEELTGTTVD